MGRAVSMARQKGGWVFEFLDKMEDEKMMADFDRWAIRILTSFLLIAMGVVLGLVWAWCQKGM